MICVKCPSLPRSLPLCLTLSLSLLLCLSPSLFSFHSSLHHLLVRLPLLSVLEFPSFPQEFYTGTSWVSPYFSISGVFVWFLFPAHSQGQCHAGCFISLFYFHLVCVVSLSALSSCSCKSNSARETTLFSRHRSGRVCFCVFTLSLRGSC